MYQTLNCNLYCYRNVCITKRWYGVGRGVSDFINIQLFFHKTLFVIANIICASTSEVTLDVAA